MPPDSVNPPYAAFLPTIPVVQRRCRTLSCEISHRGGVVLRPTRRLRVQPAVGPSRSMPRAADRVLWADDITKTHDGRTFQFKSVSLSLQRGAKVAVLGANGCGKSTLFSVLAGLISPDSGTVSVRKGVSLALVSQELPADLDMSQSALSAVLSLAAAHTSSPDVRAALRYARAAAALNEAESTGVDLESRLDDLAKAATAMDERPAAWEVDSYLQTAMDRLELPRTLRVKDLSGGQKRRVGIAAALVSRPDVLLLDEVTNHLSIEGIQFLEETLQDPDLSIFCISHDRYFVDAVCTTAIWELDGELHRYGPGYDSFLTEKAMRIEAERKEMADLAKAFRRELEWMRKQPKARSTKAKSRIADFEKLEKVMKARKAKIRDASRVKGLSAGSARLGNDVVTLENVTLKRGETVVLGDFSYTFERGERVGICGGNGVGKSSFLRALLGQLPLEAGEIRVGDTVVFGHFDQDGIDLSAPLSEASAALLASKGGDELRVIDYVNELVSLFGSNSVAGKKAVRGRKAATSDSGEEAEARLAAKIEALSHSVAISKPSGRTATGPLARMTPIGILDHFGFGRQQQHNFVSSLSGGERRRLQLMALLLKNPNFLLLDEVSNDLDVNTLTMLEELLLDYSGVLVLCSHDRFMLDRLVDHLLIIEGDGNVSLVEGKFTEYLDTRRAMAEESKRQKKTLAMAAQSTEQVRVGGLQKPDKKRKLSYKEKREYDVLETELEEFQLRYNELSRKLQEQATSAGYANLAEWTAELARTEEQIEAKTARWVELAEIAGD